METNIAPKDELKRKADILLAAAYDFWQEHQKLGGPRAVVWLTDDNGRLVIFTRGEYKNQLMSVVRPLSEETPLDDIPPHCPICKRALGYCVCGIESD
jgi:hypothetical protein